MTKWYLVLGEYMAAMRKEFKTDKSPPVQKLRGIFHRFTQEEATSSILLILTILIAVIWINLPFGHTYTALWHTSLAITIGNFTIEESLLHWINDGLMAIFFFYIGLEIKRELMVGELVNFRRALFPLVAAVGGMVVPALCYLSFNPLGTLGSRGWGVPMSTDIAISLGILAILGTRAPRGLKIFLTTYAIVDDLGAVVVVAVVYSSKIYWGYVLLGMGFLGSVVFFNWLGIRHPLWYALPGLVVWFAFFNSGIHATIAGILLAMTIPASKRLDFSDFYDISQKTLDHLSDVKGETCPVRVYERSLSAVRTLEQGCRDMRPPLQVLESTLMPWIVYGIIPLFALANAGV